MQTFESHYSERFSTIRILECFKIKNLLYTLHSLQLPTKAFYIIIGKFERCKHKHAFLLHTKQIAGFTEEACKNSVESRMK